MLSLRLIREDPNRVRRALADRHTSAPIDEILGLDAERRRLLADAESLRARRNSVSQEIARMKDKPRELILQMRDVGEQIKAEEQRLAEIEEKLGELILYLPNLPEPTVPVGEDAEDNVEIRRWGEPCAFRFPALPHWDLGEKLGDMDFARGAKISGTRSWVLEGDLARLNRALISFMMDLHAQEQGYREVLTPYLVKADCMVGTGQFPKFAGEYYTVDEGELTLIPTSEVPVVNLHRDEILPGDELPLNYVSYSACFRKEAGASGRDTRGLIRVHQFEKVEMVTLCAPEASTDALERLVRNAEAVLQKLDLRYRVMLLCTGDLGFTAAKTYDLEAWFPGQQRWIEISSCSTCDAFQARRANIRYRPSPNERPEFVHTLNGSGLPIGRTLSCILETYQQADGSIVVPEALRPYLGGLPIISGRAGSTKT